MFVYIHFQCVIDLALYCGSMLQEVIRHEDLCKLLLTPEITETLVKLTYNDLFDIASDAFNTFKVHFSVRFVLFLRVFSCCVRSIKI